MQARHVLAVYQPSYRPLHRLNRSEPPPDYRVHPIMWVILASGVFWAALIASLLALFG